MSLASVRGPHETANQVGDLIGSGIEREVSGIEHVNLGFGHVASICPERAPRLPIGAQAFVVSDRILDIRASTRLGAASAIRNPTGPP